MNPPKFQLGQMVHHQLGHSGMVTNIQFFDGEWLYAVSSPERDMGGPSGYPEDVLHAEPLTEEMKYKPRPFAPVEVDVSSVGKWISEAAKLIPPEEGNGYQPTLDAMNHVTMHHNALLEAIREFDRLAGVETKFR